RLAGSGGHLNSQMTKPVTLEAHLEAVIRVGKLDLADQSAVERDQIVQADDVIQVQESLF
ncbi:MAG TPA: hypothetical protein VLL50_08950, partial [Usitatibacter sp.]|nr:hypothetical protein [Usitatibacter sp.]